MWERKWTSNFAIKLIISEVKMATSRGVRRPYNRKKLTAILETGPEIYEVGTEIGM